MKAFAVILFFILTLPGCGLFGKKNFEDTDTYKELMREQEETDKKLDSIRRQNYKQLTDSNGHTFGKDMDSLKRSTDSLKKVLENSIESLKNKK
jgi:uncharacterized protein YlxW (UPF0749 family)